MKRFVLVLVACGGGDKPVERPVVTPTTAPTVTQTAPVSPPHVGPPLAAAKPVRETMHGVVVEDPYRWLEGNDAAVKRWQDAQNTHARKILDGLPEIEALRAEVTAIFKAPITTYGAPIEAKGKLFLTRKQPTKEQQELVVVDDPGKMADARVILDPSAESATKSIVWFEPSPDGTRVAVVITDKGSEAGDLHILGLDGKAIEVIPNVNRGTGGGSAAWTPDGKGIYYTRYPAEGEKPEPERDFWMQVWFHAIGKPVKEDRYELGKELPKIAEIQLDIDRKGRLLATVQNGDGGNFRHYLRDAKGAWKQLTDWSDEVPIVGFSTTDDLWIVSRKDAPRGQVMSLSAKAKSIADAKLVVAQAADSIHTDFWDHGGVVDAGDRIYVTYQTGGPMELRAFTRAGKPAKAPALPPVAASAKPIVLRDGTALVLAASYTTPRAWYRFNPKGNTTVIVDAMSPKPPVDLSKLEVIRETAISKDGTKVPLTILWPAGAPKDGSTRCLATGYGGYGASETPHYATWVAPLLTRGVCAVFANTRGGAEFGEEWHRAGMLTKKQNVFDDFAAVLKFLVDNKYTRSERLAILGASNGGLLMGAIITQHPKLVKAVVALVGIFDSVRSETSANGEYNVPEFGTVKDKAQFEAIYAYSPYHRVKPKTQYPAVLMTGGEHDPRVPIWHPRKMTAALQAAQSGSAPILLRTSATAGHGMGTAMSERINDQAQVFAFVLWQLGSK